MKKSFAEAGFPSMKELKAQKAALSKQKIQQRDTMRQNREKCRQLEIIKKNVDEILGKKLAHIDRSTSLL